MGAVVGTIRKIVLNGVSYEATADANFTFNATKFAKEAIATTGRTFFKKTRRPQTVEGELELDPAGVVSVKALSEGDADITMSIELADGSVFKATGEIFFDTFETDTGKGKITLMPRGDWTPFLN